MFTLEQYINDPCGSASLPYWKQKSLVIPINMKIVHESDYSVAAYNDYIDEPYFRLYHDLKNIRESHIEGLEVITAAPTGDFVELINASYTDISVTNEQMEGYRNTPVYCSDLWILLKDRSGIIVGGGIADYDKEVGEGILEWIQVLPAYRRRGLGKLIVNNLLLRMRGVAKFATVSGKVNNRTYPEKLYRKCGFVGDDIWHILTKK